MPDQLVALIVDESKWLTTSMGFALLATTIQLYGRRNSDFPARRRVSAAMNLFFGVTIGTMAFGHLLAVTTKLAIRDAGRVCFRVLRDRHGPGCTFLVAHPSRAEGALLRRRSRADDAGPQRLACDHAPGAWSLQPAPCRASVLEHRLPSARSPGGGLGDCEHRHHHQCRPVHHWLVDIPGKRSEFRAVQRDRVSGVEEVLPDNR